MWITRRALAFSTLLLVSWLAQAKVLDTGRVQLERQTAHLKGREGKEAVIHYPVVKGVFEEGLRLRIQESIGLKAGTDSTLEEWKAEFQESWWLEEVDYEVRYNRNSILNLVYTVSGVGAYPDSFSKSLVVDLRTGKRLKAGDLFKSSSLEALAARLNGDLKEDVRKTRRKWGNELDGMEEQMESARFDSSNLGDFTIDERGITFRYDFGFPHVIKAAEPSGKYFLNWQELKPYIAPQGAARNLLRAG